MTIHDIADDTFRKHVGESKTWTELLKKCGYTNTGNASVAKKRAQRMNALTDTYRGKNIKTFKEVAPKPSNHCIDCNQEILELSERCVTCYKKYQEAHLRKVVRPSYEQLVEDMANLSMVAIGNKYGVSDNSIRKWVKRYEKNMSKDKH